MKNNTLAMLATISIVLGLASIIGYIDPAVCAGSAPQEFITCEQAATQHLLGFAGFTSFGVITLLLGTIRNRAQSRKLSKA
ncbi:MAG: hypothetical protein ACKOWH_03675 [Rhodoluna sp.]